MKLILDYNLIIEKNVFSMKQNWSLSNQHIMLTSEFNAGIQVKYSIDPYNLKLPRAICNVKTNDISIFLSRNVLQTILRFKAIFMYGSKLLSFTTDNSFRFPKGSLKLFENRALSRGRCCLKVQESQLECEQGSN